ncbi:unnamed protein product [Linum tenue]|uniref:F-box domain-containing protein n=1 Tax=Linum tenue TaxID=586396 RepID=A0AAV0JTS9_9ROSI|nr:unnamed protein product [Linum tenue]
MDSDDSSSSYEIGRAGKRARCEEEEEEEEEEEGDDDGELATDRLSHLPKPLIYQILSLLDTKSAVQTCVLSRMWRCAWKYVPFLSFRRDSFEQYSSFQMYVEEVLSLRFPESVCTVSYIDNERLAERRESLFVKVVRYALSHGAQHLDMDLNNKSGVFKSCCFSNLFGTVSNCDLRTLKLQRVKIEIGFDVSGFRMLTDLNLEQCPLVSEVEGEVDPFSGFPCLKNLVLTECIHSDFVFREDKRSFKISGPQLLTLELDCLMAMRMEICAPKLESFKVGHDLQFLNFANLSIPSLVHAHLRLCDGEPSREDNKKQILQRLISMFQGFNNATSLKLDYQTVQVLSNIDFEFLERQPSPFTKLKSLIVEALSIPHALLDYLLKGSSSMKPNVEYGYGQCVC